MSAVFPQFTRKHEMSAGLLNPVCTRESVTIIGGGPSGAAAAIAFRRRGIDVTWLIRRHINTLDIGDHISADAVAALKQLGVYEFLEPGRHLASDGVVSLWSGNEHFVERSSGVIDAGVNIDRHQFQTAAIDTARNLGVEVVEIQNIEAIEWHDSSCTIATETDAGTRCVSASFLIDATGRSAVVSRRIGQPPKRLDRLVGLFARLPSCSAAQADSRLLIEPMPDGWWYSLALNDGTIAAAYLTDSDLYPADSQSMQKFWQTRWRESNQTRARSTRSVTPTEFRVGPVHTQWSPCIVGENWLAVGDACMCFDPIAGRGISKGIDDSLAAVDAVTEYFSGNEFAIAQYSRSRLSIFREYLAERYEHYALESRWKNNKFWRRRQLMANQPAASGRRKGSFELPSLVIL